MRKMRPIDSENVIAYLNAQIEKVQAGWLHDYGFPTNVIAALTDAKNLVRNLPTIDAPTERHGRWIPTEYDSYADGAPVWDKWECSVCGNEHNGEEDTLTAFCADCGAKMDGEENDG